MQKSLLRIRAAYERMSAGVISAADKPFDMENTAPAIKTIPRGRATDVSKPAIIKSETIAIPEIRRIQPLTYPQSQNEIPQPENDAVEELRRYISFDARRYSQNMAEEGE